MIKILLKNGYARPYHVVCVAKRANKVGQCSKGHVAIEIFMEFAQ
jgi:hypothetical protein